MSDDSSNEDTQRERGEEFLAFWKAVADGYTPLATFREKVHQMWYSDELNADFVDVPITHALMGALHPLHGVPLNDRLAIMQTVFDRLDGDDRSRVWNDIRRFTRTPPPPTYQEIEDRVVVLRLLRDNGVPLDDDVASMVTEWSPYNVYALEKTGWEPSQRFMDDLVDVFDVEESVVDHLAAKGAPVPACYKEMDESVYPALSPVMTRRLLEEGYVFVHSTLSELPTDSYFVLMEWEARKDAAAVEWEATHAATRTAGVCNDITALVTGYIATRDPKKRRRAIAPTQEEATKRMRLQ